MFIETDGNVGIGTTAPVNQLHVGDGTDNNTWIGVQATAGYYSGIKLSRGAGDWSSTANNNFGVIVTDAGIAISKFTDPGSNVTGRGDYLTVVNGGSVGIGTTAPTTYFWMLMKPLIQQPPILRLERAGSGIQTLRSCTC